jgi:phage terminase large subunit-like protein
LKNYVLKYWQAIEAGDVIVSKRVRQQYERLAREIESPGRYVFDLEKANRPIEFIETFCKHSKGEWAGQPIKLELFQKAFIAALFGFVDKDTGLRRFREAMFYCGRKNGKTVLMSSLALYMMMADGEGGAEVYSIATKYEQARILFDEAHNMVRQSPYLSKHVRKRKTDLYFNATMSLFRPLGKNSNTLDGLNSHAVFVDELHAVQDRGLYDVMRQSMSARRQPLLIIITTAGTVREGVFDDLYSYACQVVDGTFEDDTFLPVLYELDSRDEWTDPSAWPKANPGLGVIKKLDDLQQKVERAKNNPSEQSGVLTKEFNVRETTARAWLTFEQLNNEETFDLEDFRGFYAIGGADLSRVYDLTCATLLMVDPKTETRFVTQMYWLPEDGFMERVEQDKVPYDVWHSRGLLRLTPGNTIDYRFITRWFLEMIEQYSIVPLWVFYDAWSATFWVQDMEAQGFNMVPVRQGAKTLSIPMQQLGADLTAKKVNYGNHPILKWCLACTEVVQDRNQNWLPAKPKNSKMKIDGMASLLNAYVGLMARYQEYLGAL